MNKNFFTKLLLFSLICLFYFFSYATAHAYDYDESPKIKIDRDLFNEYCKLMQEHFTNAKFEGTIKQMVNGAFVESKYIAYSKDLEYKKIDLISYGERFSKDLDEKNIDLFSHGDKFSMVITPKKVWYYFEKSNYVIYYEQKKNVAKFNNSFFLEFVKDDGKIVKNISDGLITYRIMDYINNITQTAVFDETTKKLKTQLIETADGEKMEITYKDWQYQQITNYIFRYPSNAGSKCAD